MLWQDLEGVATLLIYKLVEDLVFRKKLNK